MRGFKFHRPRRRPNFMFADTECWSESPVALDLKTAVVIHQGLWSGPVSSLTLLPCGTLEGGADWDLGSGTLKPKGHQCPRYYGIRSRYLVPAVTVS